MQCGPKCEINISEQSRYQYKNSQISHVICSIAAKYRVYNWCHPGILKSQIKSFYIRYIIPFKLKNRKNYLYFHPHHLFLYNFRDWSAQMKWSLWKLRTYLDGFTGPFSAKRRSVFLNQKCSRSSWNTLSSKVVRLHFRTQNQKLEDDLLHGQVQRLGHVL